MRSRTIPQGLLTRRQFSVMAGGAIALAPLDTATALKSTKEVSPPGSPTFLFVASAGNTIDVLAPNTGSKTVKWRLVCRAASESPSSLALSPCQRFLYACNAVSCLEHRFTGSVSAYAIDSSTGALSLLSRQPLALSSVRPENLVVSPGGDHLVVAATGGAAYNLFPIAKDGSIGRVTASLKQVGVGLDPNGACCPAPRAVVFASDTRVLGADSACDRITSFKLDAESSLSMDQHHAIVAGSGPTRLAVHPGGDYLFVAGHANSRVSSFQLAGNAGLDLRNQVILPAGDGGITSMALQPSGKLLFLGNDAGIWAIRVHGVGTLSLRGLTEGSTQHLATSRDGRCLYSVTGAGRLERFAIDEAHEALYERVELFHLDRPVAIALKSI